MNKSKLKYFKDSDIIHVVVSDEKEFNSVEINPNITVELNDKNEIIGIEISDASSYIRDSILDTAQAKLLVSK